MINTKPQVRVLADSLSPDRVRLTTFELKYWRPLLPEMNTHRVFSRNASSSRAKSWDKTCDEVRNDCWCPAHWNAEQPGMSGGKEFDVLDKAFIDSKIQDLGCYVVDYLRDLDDEFYKQTGMRIHKQYLNRYTEPFRCTTQILTATDWDNFFKLRISDQAQPEIKDVAEAIKEILDKTYPQFIGYEGWHLPYITQEDKEHFGIEILKKISVARCARVSYRAYTKGISLDKDIELYERLLKNGHLSPFEHVATPATKDQETANFKGWIQLRHMV